jgi:hypothetical protein
MIGYCIVDKEGYPIEGLFESMSEAVRFADEYAYYIENIRLAKQDEDGDEMELI